MSLTKEWADAIGSYVEYMQAGGAKRGSMDTRRQHLYRIARGLGGSPWAVETTDLVRWFAAQSWATETRRGYRNSLKSFYKWALLAGHAASDPVEALPAVKAAKPHPRPVTDEAYRHALARADERVRLMVRLAGELGLRRAEVATVHSRNMVEDLEGWSLIVTGKGDKTRVLPLPSGLASELRALPKGWAFPGEDGGHLSPRWVGTLVGRVLPDGWTMHKLRHRFATKAYEVDRDVFTVQDLLGHASPATTRVYVAMPRDSLRRTVEAVGR
ncbi:MAG: tyrosine-type recombinase/integrase [Aeromicrobium sp.]|uniref:tyrosine-type recombinase/integrase n=1 Tax=Aeromicrobium sp. TaxID=1871063 RepID=UPI0039E2150A